MISFAILSLFLGLVLAEPIPLRFKPEPRVGSNAHSNGAIRARNDSYIVGGTDAVAGNDPWQVSLRRTSHSCGASIISETYIVTAGHCISGVSAASLSVRYNTMTHASGGTIVQLSRVILHPQYDSWELDYDAGILETATPLTLGTQLANKVTLAALGSDPATGVVHRVTGWGTLSSGGSLPPNLKTVDVPVVSRAACDQAYGSAGYSVTPQMFCLGVPEGGKDACQGDSGGPVIDSTSGTPILVGAVSWGIGCAQAQYPGVYTRLAAQGIRDWIQTNTEI